MSDSYGLDGPIAVLGAGAWGATLANMAAAAGCPVRVWDHSPAARAQLRETRIAPAAAFVTLEDSIVFPESMAETLDGAGAAVFVIPSQAYADVCGAIARLPMSAQPPIAVIASKGIDIASLRPLADVVSELLPGTTPAVLSGPCIAREVAAGVPTSVVVACQRDAIANMLQTLFSSRTFRVYRQRDLLGVELGGAFKNVIAIAAGACDGLGFGDNSKSALLCRGLAEMTRLGVAMGAEATTLAGLAGLGDLTVTCFSPHSRNRRFGEMLARGTAPADAFKEIGAVVEGAPSAAAAVKLAERHGVEVPIMRVVDAMATGRMSAKDALHALMSRSLKAEFDE